MNQHTGASGVGRNQEIVDVSNIALLVCDRKLREYWGKQLLQLK